MKSSNLRNIAKGVLELEILALKKLKKSINKTFEDAGKVANFVGIVGKFVKPCSCLSAIAKA